LGSPHLFWNDAKPPTPRTTHDPREDDPAEECTTCYVEEEFSHDTEEKINTTSGEPPEEVAQQNKQQEHQGGSVNKGRDETDAQKLAPLSSTPRQLQDQPPLLHLEHLELIFETHNMVHDQIFRAIQINQRFPGNSVQWRSLLPKEGGLIQMDIGGHPPIPRARKIVFHLGSFSIVVWVPNFWGCLEAPNDVFCGFGA
jgi:hypothetical protein